MRRRLAGAYLSSVLSISLVLMLVGLASLLVVNARRVSDYFKEKMQVSVLLRQEVSDAQAEAYKTELEAEPFAHEIRLVTREEGTEELKQMLGDDFLTIFEQTPVPISLELTLNAPYVSSDSIEVVKAKLESSKLVEEVDSRTSLVDLLNSNLSKISLILGIFILLMLFISTVLISNTVRLSIYARRFTIHTMRLVGASRGFIRRPFMGRAVIQGLIASLIAIAALGVGIYFAWKSFPQLFSIFDPMLLAIVAGIIVVCGVGICLISTYFVVNKLISIDKDKLYY